MNDRGAGVFNGGTITLTNCMLLGNTDGTGDYGGYGGGGL